MCSNLSVFLKKRPFSKTSVAAKTANELSLDVPYTYAIRHSHSKRLPSEAGPARMPSGPFFVISVVWGVVGVGMLSTKGSS